MTIKKSGKDYELVSHKGKTLYKSPSKKAVEKREKQIQYFKNNEEYKKDHGTSIPRRKRDWVTITLYNEDNISVCRKFRDTNTKFDLIYGDCIYESTNTNWITYAEAVLKENGILIIQTDYHSLYWHLSNMQYYVGIKQLTFVNHLIYINNWGGTPRNRFAQKQDYILFYCQW